MVDENHSSKTGRFQNSPNKWQPHAPISNQKHYDVYGKSNVSFGQLPSVSTAQSYHLQNKSKLTAKLNMKFLKSGHGAKSLGKYKLGERHPKKMGSLEGTEEAQGQETL